MAVVVDPKSVQREERDIRVEDYLNDKLQTCDDLENLESLLFGVKNQHDVLTKQVSSTPRYCGNRLTLEYCSFEKQKPFSKRPIGPPSRTRPPFYDKRKLSKPNRRTSVVDC
jgi:hypothetical protein